MLDDLTPQPLTDTDRQIHQWQMWVQGMGERGQQRLKGARVLISRCGGLGSLVAYELAAAGVGTLIIAHGGVIKPSDLNRQLLCTHAGLGQPRAPIIAQRLRELNPAVNVIPVAENVSEGNAARLVGLADVVVDAAPLFPERFAMNRQSVLQHKPLVECAMYSLEAQITTILPGQTACLACIHPTEVPTWKREFPVFGAVSGSVGCLAAMEVIKLITGLGQPLAGRLLRYDLGNMTFRTFKTHRNPQCEVCGQAADQVNG